MTIKDLELALKRLEEVKELEVIKRDADVLKAVEEKIRPAKEFLQDSISICKDQDIFQFFARK